MPFLQRARRQGVAREAIGAVWEYVRDGGGADELIARAHESNGASLALLRSLGWREVGLVETAFGRRVEFRTGLRE